MFTGLIEEVGRLHSVKTNEISILSKHIINDCKIGDSIAVNGICLTVTEKKSDRLNFHVSPTTINHTRFRNRDIKIGEEVNLERALKPSDRLGGHIVTGHIDGIIKIISIKKQGEDTYYEFLFPKELRSYIAPKGSVAIDGISLTVNDVMSSSFTVTIIPHTIGETNLKNKRINDLSHIEVDIFSRYVRNILSTGGFRWNQ